MVEHSFFQSTTIQQKIINGKEERKEKHVTIKNGKGNKTVKHIENGETISNATVPLTKNEIKNAQNRVFMPNFWQNCKPGTNCANTKKNKNRNKNNSKKNNNNASNTSKAGVRHASNNNTKKRRRH
jgi:hypothetical protein